MIQQNKKALKEWNKIYLNETREKYWQRERNRHREEN